MKYNYSEKTFHIVKRMNFGFYTIDTQVGGQCMNDPDESTKTGTLTSTTSGVKTEIRNFAPQRQIVRIKVCFTSSFAYVNGI